MYTAKNYIDFIEIKRFDKISHHGLEVVAECFRKLEAENKQPQNTSSNSDYAKCKLNLSCKECDHNISTNPFHIICDLG